MDPKEYDKLYAGTGEGNITWAGVRAEDIHEVTMGAEYSRLLMEEKMGTSWRKKIIYSLEQVFIE